MSNSNERSDFESDSISASLTAEERQRLLELEACVDCGLKEFLKVGSALREISESRLYRETHPTFELYVAERFDITRGHAYNLISAGKAAENLASLDAPQPSGEYQLRSLTKLEPDQQQRAWLAAAEAGNGRVTHELVKNAVNEIVGKTVVPQFAAPSDEDMLEGSLGLDCRHGSLTDEVANITAGSVDLLLLTNLPGETVEERGENLATLVATVEVAMKADHQVLVFSTFSDFAEVVSVASEIGYEVGTPVVWAKNSSRSVCDYSFQDATEIILHLRKGEATVEDQSSNVFCIEGKGNDKPVALLAELIGAVLAPGGIVLDPSAGVGNSVKASRRAGCVCIAIEPDATRYDEGLELLRAA